MAKKSKTQRAKASAARQARKAERERLEEAASTEVASEQAKAVESSDAKEKSGKGLFKRQDKAADSEKAASAESSQSKKKSDSSDSKPKKKRFQFFRDVRSELKRVTWPTRVDVFRWSGVVACALLFFGIFTAVLDNFVVTPLLFLISGADPSSIDWFSSFTVTDAGSSADASSAVDASAASEGDSGAGE